MSASNGRVPRGRPASSATVAYWKVLHQAGEPLTHDQVAERWTDRTGFMSDAMRAYREYKEQHDPTWLEGKAEGSWSRAAKEEAWRWWVREIGKSLINIKRISVYERRNGNQNIPARTTYVTAEPPIVQRFRYKAVSVLVPYDPDEVEDEDAGHVAGMRYMQSVDDAIAELEKIGDKSFTGKELRHRILDLLRDGKHAIRRRTTE